MPLYSVIIVLWGNRIPFWRATDRLWIKSAVPLYPV